MRSDILAALKRRLQPVPVPVPGGGSVLIRPWTMGERAAFAVWRKANPDYPGLCEKLFALSVCDEAGGRVFTDEPGELDVIADLDGEAVQAVAARVQEINGMTEDPKA